MKGPPRLQVRARVRKDLDMLRASFLPELSPTIVIPNRDYPYRGYCSHEEWAGALVQISLAITYSNFKNEVTRTQGQPRHDLYSRVWGVMNNAEHTLQGMEDENRRWREREKKGWFSSKASPAAKRQYDRKHSSQLMLGPTGDDDGPPVADDDLIDTGLTVADFDISKFEDELNRTLYPEPVELPPPPVKVRRRKKPSKGDA